MNFKTSCTDMDQSVFDFTYQTYISYIGFLFGKQYTSNDIKTVCCNEITFKILNNNLNHIKGNYSSNNNNLKY